VKPLIHCSVMLHWATETSSGQDETGVEVVVAAAGADVLTLMQLSVVTVSDGCGLEVVGMQPRLSPFATVAG